LRCSTNPARPARVRILAVADFAGPVEAIQAYLTALAPRLCRQRRSPWRHRYMDEVVG
jgi:hypothetical protein